MKQLTTLAVVLLVAAGAWLYRNQPAPSDVPATAPLPAPRLERAPGQSTPTNADEGPAHQEPGDDGTEVVLGLRVRKDRNCEVELNDYVTPDGEMFSAYTCRPFEPRAEHPYEHYTNETLEQMAYADAEAAAYLGKRLAGTDHGKSYQMLVRATALDGDTRHLAWLGDVTYGEFSRNGELQVGQVMRRYELAALAARLGEDPGYSLYLRDELRAAGIASEQIEQLDARVQELLDTVRSIQLTVYGEVRTGGQDDA